jgi:hypothetical protein
MHTKKASELTQEVRDQLDTLLQLLRRIDAVSTDADNADLHHRTRAKLADERFKKWHHRGLNDVQRISARFEMLDVSDAAEVALRHKIRKDILKTLAFPAMTERYEDIAEA